MIAINGGNEGGSGYWNFSNKNKEGYSTVLEGTVVRIAVVQDHQWDGSKQVLQYWPDGNPKQAIELTILNATTGRDTKTEFRKRSAMMRAVERALPGSNDLEDLAGKYIRITTAEGVYNASNPRPFSIEILGDNPQLYRGTLMFDGTINWPHGMQPNVQPQPQYQQPAQQAPQQPVQMQQPQYQQPMQPQPMQAPAASQGYPQQQYQQPVQQVPMQQPQQYQQPQQQQYQQPVQQVPAQQPEPSVYDPSIPF